ncbi:hypothetical protein D3800_12185 [Microcystis aeruginosa NIES-298]|nr:hypothetical protein D3800_12185 [Microcystis aeruginosa NIES-298]TRU10886.1 MAG: hypothetical protein EWV58_19635 [Microcystis aeruginosa Ma_MB_F_20061100_S19]TRU11408.1 MAG: hypothetical protein EWV59_10370 [Microcystis aeruginosa Ma_MB_F_20061100_S19D]
MSIVCYLERTNQLSLLPDKYLVDLCPPYRTITSNEEPHFSSLFPKLIVKHYIVFQILVDKASFQRLPH